MAMTQSNDTSPWTLGDYMRKARRLAGLDQDDVAKGIGVSRALVGHWENDRSEPSYRRLVKFSELTSFDLDVLLSAIGYISNDAGEGPNLSIVEGTANPRRTGFTQSPLVASVH